MRTCWCEENKAPSEAIPVQGVGRGIHVGGLRIGGLIEHLKAGDGLKSPAHAQVLALGTALNRRTEMAGESS